PVTPFAPSSARVLAIESSNALLTALAWMPASFSRAANWVLATARNASTLALLAAWICSGVTYIGSRLLVPSVGSVGLVGLVGLVALRAGICASQQCAF